MNSGLKNAISIFTKAFQVDKLLDIEKGDFLCSKHKKL